MDVDNIKAGDNFVEALESTLKTTDLMLVVIGKSWLTALDEQGRRRLDDPQDYVRREIATALARDIRVVPLLVQGATLPSETELPEPLKPLAKRQALELRHQGYSEDVGRLAIQLQDALAVAVPNENANAFNLWRTLKVRSARSVSAWLAVAMTVIGLGTWTASSVWLRFVRAGSARPAVRFTSVALPPYTTDPIDWLVKVPVGEQTFDGVAFKILACPRAAVKSAMVGRPTWPTRFSCPIGAERGIQRVHAMLTGSW